MLRAIYAQAELNSMPASDLLQLFDDKKGTFSGVGFKYTLGDLFLLGELAESKIADAANDTRSYYLATGYTIGAFTPYVRYAVNKTLDDELRPQTGELTDISSYNADYSNTSIGARWDFTPSAALKADATHRKDENRDDATVYTISIDTVF